MSLYAWRLNMLGRSVKTAILAGLLICFGLGKDIYACGWAFVESKCVSEPNPIDMKGAYCNEAQCYSGYVDPINNTSYKQRRQVPGWVCPGWPYSNTNCLGCPSFVFDDYYEWKIDPDNECCGLPTPDPCCGKGPDCCSPNNQTQSCMTAEGCSGIKTCSSGNWSACVKTDPCCGEPDCDCCRQKNGGNCSGDSGGN